MSDRLYRTKEGTAEIDADMRDAALFRLWIRLANTCPGRVARALSPCISADQYRAAIVKLAREERLNVPGI